MDPLLEISDLRIRFQTETGTAHAVDSVTLAVGAGEIVGLVGESGCGKSVTALSILRLLDSPPAEYVSGAIHYSPVGVDLLEASAAQLLSIRGSEISMVFQEPMSALNPVHRCGSQIEEAIRLHRGLTGKAAKEAALGTMSLVGLPDPAVLYNQFPHELSGGMRQRVLIAIAVACHPKLLIADEPTTALDVTIQAQILQLLRELRSELGTAILLITHDLGVVASIADTVAVMYAGEIVEIGSADQVLGDPRHPYTRALLRAAPDLSEDSGRPVPIDGSLPDPCAMPRGCRFHDRCAHGERSCRDTHPELLFEGNRGDRCPPLRGGKKA